MLFQDADQLVSGGSSDQSSPRVVVIGAGAIVLGAITLGDHSRVGAGSVVLHDIPPHSTAVGVPARVGLGFSDKELTELEHSKLPDPIADAIQFVLKEQEKLEDRIAKLEVAEGLPQQSNQSFQDKKKELEKEFE